MSRVQLTNPAEVPDLFRLQFELCNVQEGETIVVLSDIGTRKEFVEADGTININAFVEEMVSK